MADPAAAAAAAAGAVKDTPMTDEEWCGAGAGCRARRLRQRRLVRLLGARTNTLEPTGLPALHLTSTRAFLRSHFYLSAALALFSVVGMIIVRGWLVGARLRQAWGLGAAAVPPALARARPCPHTSRRPPCANTNAQAIVVMVMQKVQANKRPSAGLQAARGAPPSRYG